MQTPDMLFRAVLFLSVIFIAPGCSSSDDPGPEGPEPDQMEGSLYYSQAGDLVHFDFSSQLETVLFSDGGHYTLSPGGEEFVWYKNDYGKNEARVQIHNTQDPGTYHPVTLPYNLEYTPDIAPGTDLLAALIESDEVLRNDLVLFDREGNTSGVLPHVKDFAFAPNGTDLVISAEALDDQGEVIGWTLALIRNYRSESPATVVVREFPDYDQLPRYLTVSPNSATVAYTHLDHLYTLPLQEGAEQRQVTTSKFKEIDAGWSPDGRYLVFSANVTGHGNDCGELRIIPAQPGEAPIRIPEDGWDNAPVDALQPVDESGKTIHACGSDGNFWATD